MVKKLRESFRSGKTRQKSFRIQQLKNLLRMLDEKEDEITEAGHRDLRKVNLLMYVHCVYQARCIYICIVSQLVAFYNSSRGTMFLSLCLHACKF